MGTKGQLIIDYHKRSLFQKRCASHLQAFNSAAVEAQAVILNNQYFLKWVTTATASIYIVWGGLQVIAGFEDLGGFIANLNIIKSLGGTWQNLFGIVMATQRAYTDLHRIVKVMNTETDFKLHSASMRKRSDLTVEALKNDCSFAMMPITIGGFTRGYALRTGAITSTLNFSGFATIKPGTLVCFLGEHGVGRATLLKLIGDDSLLRGNNDVRNVFVPAHIRKLHLTSNVGFISGTLLDNLTIGIDTPDATSFDQIHTICKRLGVSETALRHLATEEVHDWKQVLSQSECFLIGIARALVSNYELLILHRPTAFLSAQVIANVMEIFREYVTLRGVEQDPRTWECRQMRTCIFSDVWNIGVTSFCDQVFEVSKDGIKCARDSDPSSRSQTYTM